MSFCDYCSYPSYIVPSVRLHCPYILLVAAAVVVVVAVVALGLVIDVVHTHVSFCSCSMS